MLKVYAGKEDSLTKKQWELTLRMATTVLPRLNEVTGNDGDPIEMKISGMKIIRDGN